MDSALQGMISRGDIGFDDILEAYAELCIRTVRDTTEDMILDEGVAGLVKHGTDLSVEGLTAQAVDWALVVTPEMLADVTDEVKKDNESFLEFIVRTAVEKRVADTKAFQIKLS